MQGGFSVNYHYLMKHISYHLHTIVRQYIPDSGLTESYCARVSFSDVFRADEIFDIFSHIQGQLRKCIRYFIILRRLSFCLSTTALSIP